MQLKMKIIVQKKMLCMENVNNTKISIKKKRY